VLSLARYTQRGAVPGRRVRCVAAVWIPIIVGNSILPPLPGFAPSPFQPTTHHLRDHSSSSKIDSVALLRALASLITALLISRGFACSHSCSRGPVVNGGHNLPDNPAVLCPYRCAALAVPPLNDLTILLQSIAPSCPPPRMKSPWRSRYLSLAVLARVAPCISRRPVTPLGKGRVLAGVKMVSSTRASPGSCLPDLGCHEGVMTICRAAPSSVVPRVGAPASVPPPHGHLIRRGLQKLGDGAGSQAQSISSCWSRKPGTVLASKAAWASWRPAVTLLSRHGQDTHRRCHSKPPAEIRFCSAPCWYRATSSGST